MKQFNPDMAEFLKEVREVFGPITLEAYEHD